MKRLIFLLLICITAIPLFSSVAVEGDEGISTAILSVIEDTLDKELEYLIAEDVSVYASIKEVKGNLVILSLDIKGESVDIVFDMSEGRSGIRKAIRDSLRYFLPQKENSLSYIYPQSYSALNLDASPRGALFALKGANGQTSALFAVDDKIGEATILSPLYINRAYTGMMLEKKASIELKASFLSVFMPEFRYGVKVNMKYLPLLYPLNPVIGFQYAQDKGFYGALGFEYRLSFASIFSSSFSLVQDGGITASASLLLGSNDGFSWGFSWDLLYEHHFTPYLYWNIGFNQVYATSYDSGTPYASVAQNYLSAGIGVLL